MGLFLSPLQSREGSLREEEREKHATSRETLLWCLKSPLPLQPLESLSHVAPSEEGMGCWGQTLGKNLLLRWLKQSHVQRVLLLLWCHTNLRLQNAGACNNCSTEDFTRGIQVRENAAFQWFKSAKRECKTEAFPKPKGFTDPEPCCKQWICSEGFRRASHDLFSQTGPRDPG